MLILSQNYILQDHSYNCNEQEASRRVADLENEVEALRKKLRNAEVRERRAKLGSKKLLDKLSECNTLTAELESKLASYQGKYIKII